KIEHRAGKQQQCQNRAIPAEAVGTDGAREQAIGDDPKQQPGNLGADRAAQVVEQREVQRHRAPAARAGHERLHEDDSGGEGRANGPVDAGFARTQADGGLTVAPTLAEKAPHHERQAASPVPCGDLTPRRCWNITGLQRPLTLAAHSDGAPRAWDPAVPILGQITYNPAFSCGCQSVASGILRSDRRRPCFVPDATTHAYSSSGRAACDQVTGSKVRWARETTSP